MNKLFWIWVNLIVKGTVPVTQLNKFNKTMQEAITTPDLFHLTETEFFKNLRQGLLSEDLSLHLRDFMIRVHEVATPHSTNRAFVLDVLVITDIEFRRLKSQESMFTANKALVSMVEMAHEYLCHKIEQVRKDLPSIQPVAKEEIVEDVNLNWRGNKSEFIQICHALKVAKLFGETSQAKIIRVLAKACNVDIDAQYARNCISGLQSRAQGSKGVLGKLVCAVKNILPDYDDED